VIVTNPVASTMLHQGLHYGVTMSKPVQHRTIDQGRGPITRYSERSHDVMKRCQTDLEFAV